MKNDYWKETKHKKYIYRNKHIHTHTFLSHKQKKNLSKLSKSSEKLMKKMKILKNEMYT